MQHLYSNPSLRVAVETAERFMQSEDCDEQTFNELDVLLKNINAENSRYEVIDTIADQIESSGTISTHDVHRLEKASPGIIFNTMHSDDFTFTPSTNGLEGAVEAINWAKMGKWGIIGAIVAGILALVFKLVKRIRENYKKDQENIKKEEASRKFADEYREEQKKFDEEMRRTAEKQQEEYRQMEEKQKRQKEENIRKYASPSGVIEILKNYDPKDDSLSALHKNFFVDDDKPIYKMKPSQELRKKIISIAVKDWLEYSPNPNAWKGMFVDIKPDSKNGVFDELVKDQLFVKEFLESRKENEINLRLDPKKVSAFVSTFPKITEEISADLDHLNKVCEMLEPKAQAILTYFENNLAKTVESSDSATTSKFAADTEKLKEEFAKQTQEMLDKNKIFKTKWLSSAPHHASPLKVSFDALCDDESGPPILNHRDETYTPFRDASNSFYEASNVLEKDLSKKLVALQGEQSAVTKIAKIGVTLNEYLNGKRRPFAKPSDQLEPAQLEIMKAVAKAKTPVGKFYSLTQHEVQVAAGAIKDVAQCYLKFNKHFEAYQDMDLMGIEFDLQKLVAAVNTKIGDVSSK